MNKFSSLFLLLLTAPAATVFANEDYKMLYYRLEGFQLGFFDSTSEWKVLHERLFNTLIDQKYAPLITTKSDDEIIIRTASYPFHIKYSNNKTSTSGRYDQNSSPIFDENTLSYAKLNDVTVKFTHEPRACVYKVNNFWSNFGGWKNCNLPSIFAESLEVRVLVWKEHYVVAIDRYTGKGAILNTNDWSWDMLEDVPGIDGERTTVDYNIVNENTGKIEVDTFLNRHYEGKKFELRGKKWVKTDFDVEDESTAKVFPLGYVKREILEKLQAHV